MLAQSKGLSPPPVPKKPISLVSVKVMKKRSKLLVDTYADPQSPNASQLINLSLSSEEIDTNTLNKTTGLREIEPRASRTVFESFCSSVSKINKSSTMPRVCHTKLDSHGSESIHFDISDKLRSTINNDDLLLKSSIHFNSTRRSQRFIRQRLSQLWNQNDAHQQYVVSNKTSGCQSVSSMYHSSCSSPSRSIASEDLSFKVKLEDALRIHIDKQTPHHTLVNTFGTVEALVIYDFDSSAQGMLSLQTGWTVNVFMTRESHRPFHTLTNEELVDLVSANAGWCDVEYQGKTGLAPTSYLQVRYLRDLLCKFDGQQHVKDTGMHSYWQGDESIAMHDLTNSTANKSIAEATSRSAIVNATVDRLFEGALACESHPLQDTQCRSSPTHSPRTLVNTHPLPSFESIQIPIRATVPEPPRQTPILPWLVNLFSQKSTLDTILRSPFYPIPEYAITVSYHACSFYVQDNLKWAAHCGMNEGIRVTVRNPRRHRRFAFKNNKHVCIDTYIAYQLTVYTPSLATPHTYTTTSVWKRYSDFEWLYAMLLKTFGVFVDRAGLEKVWTRGGLGGGEIERRREGLEYWIRNVVGNPVMGGEECVRALMKVGSVSGSATEEEARGVMDLYAEDPEVFEATHFEAVYEEDVGVHVLRLLQGV